MRIASSAASIQTNAQGDSVDFSIGDPSVIIEILRNKLYSDKIGVVVQEYLSNARDAMREAKNTDDKIVVTLPTAKNPTFVIRDYGTGLSPERVRNVFVQFGRSTKRDSDEQTGGFGVGAKAAWAYTDSYVVISYYDGMETHYVAHIGEKSTGTMQTVYQGATEQPNGVEIQIGVNDAKNQNDITRFHEAYFKTVAFWGPEQPKVKNLESAVIGGPWHKIYSRIEGKPVYKNKRVAFYGGANNAGYFGSAVPVKMVVDGIIYELPKHDEITRAMEPFKSAVYLNKHDMFLFAGNGEVEISASREALQIGTKTVQGIQKLSQEALAEFKKDIGQKIQEAATLTEAKAILAFLNGFVSDQARQVTRTIEGIAVEFHTSNLVGSIFTGLKRSNIGYRSKRFKTENADARLSADLFIYLDKETSNNVLKMKINKWADSANLDTIRVTVIEDGNSGVAKLLGAKNVSEMEGIKRQPTAVKKKNLAQNEVGIKVFDHELKLRNVVIQTDAGRRYIIVPASSEVPNTEYATLETVLYYSGVNVGLCFPSDKVAAELTGKAGFISWDDFVKNPDSILGVEGSEKVMKHLKRRMLYSETYRAEYIVPLSTHVKDIKDKAVVDGMVTYISFYGEGTRYSDALIDRAYQDRQVQLIYPGLQAWKTGAKEFLQYIEATYPLVGRHSGEEMTKEMVLYMNLKYANNS